MKNIDNAAKSGIIVDLDALFDTRLAILDMLDPLLAVHALENGYLDREDDNFKYCPLELFNQLYAKRNNDILGRSLMTQVKGIIIDYVKDGNEKLNTKKTGAFINVYINVWPYKIDEDAAGEILLPLHKAVDGKANIHLINIKPEELTPEVCKKNFSYIIKYDFIEWLTILAKNGSILKTPMKEITLVAPRLYPSGKPSDVQIDEEFRDSMEPHQCTEFFFAPYINLELYVARLFSAGVDNKFISALLEKIEKTQQEDKTSTEANGD